MRENQNRQGNRNAGFTLIELIVTVLIMGILACGIGVSVSQLMKNNVSTAAERIADALEQTRYENLYLEGEITLQLQYSDGDYYAVTLWTRPKDAEPTVRHRDKVASGGLTVTVVPKVGVPFVLAEGSSVTVAFQKSSGAMKEVGGVLVQSILVENASKRAELTLVEQTGRCFID